MTAPIPQPVAAPQATLVQRALGGHAAIGLLASAVLYLICLSGTLIVIHDRWQRWEQPHVAEAATIAPAAVSAGVAAVLAQDAAQGKAATTHLYVRMPTDDLPRTVVTTDHGGWYVDGAGAIAAPEAHAWTEMTIALHEYLHLPLSWGMILVGALGVMLAALVTTGVLAHPRIVRDAFRLRARHDAQLARADWHNRMGVWTLPWVLAIAITGAAIGLGSVGFTMLAKGYTGGDLERAYAPIFGHEPAPDATKAPLPDIAAALRDLAARVPQAKPIYVIVHEPGTKGSHVQLLAEHPRRLVYGESYAYDGAGRYHGKAGLTDGPAGQQIVASIYNLHFGNYAGLPVMIAYILLGLALCAITATGTTLWLEKRRRRGLGGQRLGAAWAWVVWGTPLALVATLWLRAVAGAEAPLVGAFWTLLASGLALAVARPAWLHAAPLRAATAAAILLTAIGHLVLLRPTTAGPLGIDLIAILLAGGALVLLRRPSLLSRTAR